jgi:hypothetical protein
VVPRGAPMNHRRRKGGTVFGAAGRSGRGCGVPDRMSAQPAGWVSVPAMETPGVDYGRCSDCKELKHVTADGTVADHNGYDIDGTSVVVIRCPGSGRPPVGAEEEVAPARS